MTKGGNRLLKLTKDQTKGLAANVANMVGKNPDDLGLDEVARELRKNPAVKRAANVKNVEQFASRTQQKSTPASPSRKTGSDVVPPDGIDTLTRAEIILQASEALAPLVKQFRSLGIIADKLSEMIKASTSQLVGSKGPPPLP